MLTLALLLLLGAAPAEKPPVKAPAFPADEQLTYAINWPTGLSLGEATLHTVRRSATAGPRIESEFRLDASVPGFQVLDRYQSLADGDYCSIELEKSYQHGKRKSEEKTSFDASRQIATRETKDGGKSEIHVSNCARDALAFVQFVRRELSQGRLAPHQTVLFGAEYRVSIQFAGTQSISVNEKRMDADKLNVTVKGAAADVIFEAFFAKDPVRTPVLIRVPMALATFSMELVR